MKNRIFKIGSVLLASLVMASCNSQTNIRSKTPEDLFFETPTCDEGVGEVKVNTKKKMPTKSGDIEKTLISPVGYQTSSLDDSGNINLRFVAAVYSEALSKDSSITTINDVSVTFKSTIPGIHGEQSTVCDKMYRQINNGGSPMLPSELGKYNVFVAYTIRNIPVETYFNDELTVSLSMDCSNNVQTNTSSKTVYLKHGSFKTVSHTLTHHDEIPATVELEGTKEHYSCDACDKLFILENDEYKEVTAQDLVISLHEHSYGPWTSVDGTNHQKECECGSTIVEAHTWNEGEVIDAPTCLETGTIKYTCTTCGETKEETLAATGHNYDFVAEVAATTISEGVKEHYICSHEGCDKLFVLDGQNYIEVSSNDLVIGKLASQWNGSVNFENYCIGGYEERVGASVVDNKLRFTMKGDLHYGEYRPAHYYRIEKSDTHRYTLSINGVSFSAGSENCALIINVVNNGVRTPISDYYYFDPNYKEMDLTPYVTCNDVNNVEIIIQCRFGLDGQNKQGEYVDIESIVLKDTVCAPASKQYTTGEYDIDSMFAGCSKEHINATAEEGVFTISTAGAGDTWGAVIPTTEWTTPAIEKAMLEVTVSEITTGGSLIFQVKNGEGEYYLDAFPAAPGVYRFRLASNQTSGWTGERTFRFRFGIQGGTNVTAKITSIKTIQVTNIGFNGAVDFENYSAIGDADRVNASVVNDKLRLTKFGEYHYGEFRSYSYVDTTKESGKNYYLSLSGFNWSDEFTQKIIVVFIEFGNGERVCLGNYYWSDPNYKEMDLTNTLKDGNNSFRVILQLVFGNDGETISNGYLEIDSMSLNVK